MIGKLTKAIFGSKNERELKRMRKIVVQINALEGEMEKLTDEQLRAKTAEFRQRLADGATLDQLLPEAFAAVREDRKSTRLNSSHVAISYAVFCLKKNKSNEQI